MAFNQSMFELETSGLDLNNGKVFALSMAPLATLFIKLKLVKTVACLYLSHGARMGIELQFLITAKRALQVESVIYCFDSLCTYRETLSCLPIMHSNARRTYWAQPS